MCIRDRIIMESKIGKKYGGRRLWNSVIKKSEHRSVMCAIRCGLSLIHISAIKAAREGRKESRKKVGDEMFLSPRYLANIENKGQHPSLQIFFELIQRYHISVSHYFQLWQIGRAHV